MPDPSFISEIEKFVDEYVGTYPVSSIDEAGKVIHIKACPVKVVDLTLWLFS